MEVLEQAKITNIEAVLLKSQDGRTRLQSGTFQRLTAELEGKYALIIIFICAFVCGVFWRVYIFCGVKVWVVHLGLAFLRSCFRNGERRAD